MFIHWNAFAKLHFEALSASLFITFSGAAGIAVIRRPKFKEKAEYSLVPYTSFSDQAMILLSFHSDIS